MNQLFWIGNVFGCLIWGIMNDRFGRRPTVLGSHLCYLVGGLVTLFVVHDFYLLAACRFLVGVAHHTVSHLPYMIAIEYCGKNRRTIPLFTMMASYSAGSLTIPFLTKVFPSWKALLLVATLPNLIT